MDLEELRKLILKCERCHLRKNARAPVPGEGREGAKMMLVGEAPGAKEDELGRPFVGRAGRLLRSSLKILGIPEEDVYITNVVKCRPPKNRTPTLSEMKTCGIRLEKEVLLVKPRVIVALGRIATAFFLGKSPDSIRMSKMRARAFSYRGFTVYPTYHPAAVLRNPSLGEAFREDLKKARELASGIYA